MKHDLVAEYTPRRASWFLLPAMGAMLLGFLAFVLYRFFTAGGIAPAEMFLYPVIFAVWGVLTFAAYSLKRSPQVSLYENGIAVDGSLLLWSEIKDVRYRRFENFWNRIEYEWRICTEDRQCRFSMIEPNIYIDRVKLNSALAEHIDDFRDTSRLQ